MKLTPMMQQYYDLKEQYPDSILFFRLGDFYEMFGEDAKIASEILGIALTSREAGAQGRIPMCGVPHHAAEGYLAKLIEKGHRVALCEQLEDPKTAQGVVKRGVVKVITPGTFIEGELVDKENQYLVALAFHKNWGLASIDLSTGQFMVATVSNWVEVEDELNRLKPAEIIFARDFPDAAPLTKLAGQLGAAISTLERGQPSLAKSSQDLLAHFGTSTLTPFGLDDAEKIIASGLALEYVSESQQNVLPHIRKLNAYNLQDYLHIDAHSQRNLELTKTIREGRKEGSLLGILDYTATSMGGRLLRVYLEKPLVQIEKIRQRQEAVDFLVKETALRLELRDFLGRVYDLERLLGRLVVGS
ncbi:MAG: DNA mismatch repair protein MutS, partial [Firmicutes bacterium]|nr:DNA mismatch repair protein MutS [Bacillota bacterium]